MVTSNILESFQVDVFKMVFVVREDIKITKGQIISQCAHGAIAYIKAQEHHADYLKR